MTRSILSNIGAGTMLAALALPFFASSCASMVPPLNTPHEAYRGFKARTFVGTPEKLRPHVIATLAEFGYEVHADANDRTYLTANRGMASSSPNGDAGRRTWTRVGVSIRQIDMHRRAPRTLIELKAESIQGSAEGVIEASAGSVPTAFYQDFFRSVDARIGASTRHTVRGFLPPA